MNAKRRVAMGASWCLVGVLVLLPRGAVAVDLDPVLLTWVGPEGGRVRFTSETDLRSFFESASVIDEEGIAVGVTRPRKLLLQKGAVRLHAHFQPVDEVAPKAHTPRGEVELNARDSYKFNIAAFELGALLGMDNIPPSFQRSIGREAGSVTAWIENAFSERGRTEKGLRPPDPQRWSRAATEMQIFDELIANTDRNQGNILIDENWKVWLIDHTRAFRRWDRLSDPEDLTSCDRELWEALSTLSDERIRDAVGRWLSRSETRALLARRRLLVAHFEGLIAELGEAEVLYSSE